jgi:Uma2 family endonuclease
MKKIDTRTLTPAARDEIRTMVIRLRQQSGMNAAGLGAIAGVHPGTVLKWLAWARKAGEGSLTEKLRGKPCEIYVNDMRVKVSETGMYTYPDLVAACGEPRFEDQAVDTLLNPVLIIEVLSDSTERYDRGAKFTGYRSVVTLKEYLLVSQNESRVEHYVRQPGNHWLLTEYQEMQDRIDLNSLDSYLLLAEIYERIFTLPKP